MYEAFIHDNLVKTDDRCITRTQLAKVSIDPKFVKLTADAILQYFYQMLRMNLVNINATQRAIPDSNEDYSINHMNQRRLLRQKI